jgi:hypothetical protein
LAVNWFCNSLTPGCFFHYSTNKPHDITNLCHLSIPVPSYLPVDSLSYFSPHSSAASGLHRNLLPTSSWFSLELVLVSPGHMLVPWEFHQHCGFNRVTKLQSHIFFFLTVYWVSPHAYHTHTSNSIYSNSFYFF